MPMLERPSVQLHYDLHGQGPAVVFVHGWCDDARTWQSVIAELADHACLSIDLRGHGRSGQPHDHDFSIEAASNDVAAACAHAGIERATLVGHSYGAIVAAATCARFPQLARGLVLLDQSYDLAAMQQQLLPIETMIRSTEQHLAFRTEFLGSLMGSLPDTERERLQAAIAETPVGVALAMWAPLFEWTAEELTAFTTRILKPLQDVPTSIIDREAISPYHDELRRRYPRASIEVLAGGHWMQTEHAARIAAEIRSHSRRG